MITVAVLKRSNNLACSVDAVCKCVDARRIVERDVLTAAVDKSVIATTESSPYALAARRAPAIADLRRLLSFPK